ncbi:hypothetical protein BOTCAL_0729g00030 [Botryotinia calthae]|uniref:Uncharacterized protein n=1 Tax=Botryotinia calthae TaxID=38488 RepID=A0A4Y8CGM0_9HELO|nr:hypothetical protein BOTCAL_0729g00030 [Botryotinia calthae]
MAYGAEYVRNTGKPNYAAAHAAHLRALERTRRESDREAPFLILSLQRISNKRNRANSFDHVEAREVAATIAASKPKLTNKEARDAAIKAARKQRRRERRIAQAEAALSANEALHLACRMYALRFRDPLSEKKFVHGEDYDDDGEGIKLESLDEFEARVFGWLGVRRATG